MLSHPRTTIARMAWEDAFVAAIALLLAFTGWWIAGEPMGRASWLLYAVVLMLPVAYHKDPSKVSRVDRRLVNWRSYCVAGLILTLTSLPASGIHPAAVIGSVAFSLIGMLLLLVRIGIPTPFAIGLLLVQSVLFLTWPVWGSSLLVRFDSLWLADCFVKIGPLFAINATIDPTDPLTHRPLVYRLTNLGQDIPYQMPRSIWPCVLVHLAAGLPGGFIHWSWKRRSTR